MAFPLIPILIEGLKVAVATALSYGVKKVVDYFASDKEKVQETNQASQIASENIGNARKYDPKNASIDETKRLNDELGKFKSQAFKMGAEFEAKLIELGKELIDKLAQPLQTKSKEGFESRCKHSLSRIENVVRDKISSKISLSNNECLNILKLESGSQKRESMQNFIDSTTKAAFKALGDEFSSNIKESVELVIRGLKRDIGVQEVLINNQLKTLDAIRQASSVDEKQGRQISLGLDLGRQMAALRLIGGER